MLEAIYGASLLVPSLAVQNSVSNLGDTRRLERFLSKLVTGELLAACILTHCESRALRPVRGCCLAGQPVTVVALGGSVTVGHGPENRQTAWVPRLFKCAAPLPVSCLLPPPQHVTESGESAFRPSCSICDWLSWTLLAVCSTQQVSSPTGGLRTHFHTRTTGC